MGGYDCVHGGVKICSIYILWMQEEEYNENTKEQREGYATIALPFFYSFKTTSENQLDGSYLKLFHGGTKGHNFMSKMVWDSTNHRKQKESATWYPKNERQCNKKYD